MIEPSVLDAMLIAGCTAEQIVAAVKADAQAEIARAARESEAGAARMARKREMNADRQRRHRERNASSRVTDVTNGDNPSPKESSPTPPKEITPSPSQDKSCSITPRAALETVLDAERAGAVIDHRKRLGKPLTAYAAKTLAAKLAQWPDPNFAADEMISNGWQGFKPEWLEKREPLQRRSTDPPRQERTVSDALGEMAAGTWKPPGNDHDPYFPTIETSFHRRN